MTMAHFFRLYVVLQMRVGLKTVLAPVGGPVPGIDIIIKKSNIRGRNQTACYAPLELALDGNSDGIIELAECAK